MPRESIWVVLRPNRISLLEDLVFKLPVAEIAEVSRTKRNMAPTQRVDRVFLDEQSAVNHAQCLMNLSVSEALDISIPEDYGISKIRDEDLTRLDGLFTFFNSTLNWLRKHYMEIEHLTDFYKGSYNYWLDTISGKFKIDFEYDGTGWISLLFEALNEIREHNLKSPQYAMHPDSVWLYRFVGKEALGIEISDEFGELMFMREEALELLGALDNPVSESFADYLATRRKVFIPISPAFKGVPLQYTKPIDKLDYWVDDRMMPLIEELTHEIDCRLQMIVGDI